MKRLVIETANGGIILKDNVSMQSFTIFRLSVMLFYRLIQKQYGGAKHTAFNNKTLF